MSKFFITGDTHGDLTMFKMGSKKWKEGRLLTKDDYLCIAGDFGLLWKNVPDEQEAYLTKWLNQKRFTTLFIDGNHENHPRINALPTVPLLGIEVGKVSDSVYHLKRSSIFTLEGKTFFCMGGGLSIDKMHRREGVSWWPEEMPSYREMDGALENLAKIGNKVDYIITHTMPRMIMSIMGMDRGYIDPLAKFFDHIVNNVTFERWYSGHYHEDKEFSKFTLVYDKIIQVI